MKVDFMWIWWFLTVAICTWKIAEGFVRPHRMLEWPFLASAMWAYFYGYMAYIAKTSLSAYLGNGIDNLGQLMPLLCLVGVLIGWSLGTRGDRMRSPETRTYPYFRFWLAGLFFLMIGAAGGLSVMHALDEGALNFKASSAYWYLLFYVGYPGLAMAIWALFKMEPGTRKISLWVITLLLTAAFMFPHVIAARRGPLFPAVMILLIVPPLATRRSPNPLIFCGSLAVAGLVMLLFLQARHVIYNGGTWGEAFQVLDINSAVEERNVADDNEYINNCHLIATLYQNGKYQYGTGHLGLLLHWIPRSIWKDKPELGSGYYSNDQLYDDIEAATGLHLAGSGASSAGVAESFVQYGFLCPLFWLGLSWGMGKVYVRARLGNSPRWLFCYIAFICATHWLVSQGFDAAFVPGMFFQAVAPAVFLLIDRTPTQRVRVLRDRQRSERFSLPKQTVQS